MNSWLDLLELKESSPPNGNRWGIVCLGQNLIVVPLSSTEWNSNFRDTGRVLMTKDSEKCHRKEGACKAVPR